MLEMWVVEVWGCVGVSDVEKCARCGGVDNAIDPVTGLELMATYEGRVLCSSCRVTLKLRDGTYAGGPDE